MDSKEFNELVTTLFYEYLPKTLKADRKAFIEALREELVDHGLELDSEEEDSEEDVEEIY